VAHPLLQVEAAHLLLQAEVVLLPPEVEDPPLDVDLVLVVDVAVPKVLNLQSLS